jgi:hypothetical protein
MRIQLGGLLAYVCIAATTLGAQPPIKVDLSTPLGKQVHDKLASIDREVARLRDSGERSQADQLSAEVARLRRVLDGTDTSTARPAELHMVGVYEGAFPNGPRKFGLVTVSVEATDHPITLSLSAYESVRWDIRLAAGANLQRVILSGNGEQELTSVPAGVEAEKHTQEKGDPAFFYAYKKDTPNYARATKLLHDWTGLEVSTFQGAYRANGERIVIGPSNVDWHLQRVLKQLDPIYLESSAYERAVARQGVPPVRFTAIRWNAIQLGHASGELVDFTAAGPIDGTAHPLPHFSHIAIDPRGPTYYGITGRGLVTLDLKTQQRSDLPIQGDLPRLSWPCGLAFDTKRNRLILTSLGGVGYMYAYEPDKNAWSLLGDMANVDLESLTYSADDDCLYGLAMSRGEEDRTPIIHQFSADGVATKRITISMPMASDPMVAHSAPKQLIAAGAHLIILAPPPLSAPTGPMTRYIIDPKTGRVIHSGAVRAGIEPRVASPEELKGLVDALRDVSSADSDKAVLALAAAGDPAVVLLRSKLPPLASIDAQNVEKLLQRLDADDWKDREAATADLKSIAGMIEPQLKAALDVPRPAQSRSCIEAILKQVDQRRISPLDAAVLDRDVKNPDDRLRLRAVRVLALVGTPAAVDCLRTIAFTPVGAVGSAQARVELRKI